MVHRYETLALTLLLFGGALISTADAQQSSGLVTAHHVIGLTGIRKNAKGTLSIHNGYLHFADTKGSADVSATSIEQVVTGADSQVAVGNTIHLMSMAAPYGGGRFLSLFRKKIDTLTVQYRDGDGGLHGAIFTMPVGAADELRHEIAAQGAHTIPTAESNTAAPSETAKSEEQHQ
jgi:hypothetical protein